MLGKEDAILKVPVVDKARENTVSVGPSPFLPQPWGLWSWAGGGTRWGSVPTDLDQLSGDSSTKGTAGEKSSCKNPQHIDMGVLLYLAFQKTLVLDFHFLTY